MLIRFKARRHIHPGRARRHNHRVHKGPFLYSFHLKPKGITILPKGITIVPIANYCCSFHLKPKGITILPKSITIEPRANYCCSFHLKHGGITMCPTASPSCPQSPLPLFVPFKAQRHHRVQRHKHRAQPFLMFIPLKPKVEGKSNRAKRHNHLAQRHNHHPITDVHCI